MKLALELELELAWGEWIAWVAAGSCGGEADNSGGGAVEHGCGAGLQRIFMVN